MAEGDTILRAARRIDRALCGERVEAAAPGPRGRLAGLERLDGHTLEGVEARGKHLLFDFGGLALHSHLGMNGSWRVYRRGENWGKPSAAAWAVLRGGGWEAVQFGGPTLEVMPMTRLRRKLA
ncbi:MAG TPA: DNA-formamidopyrimidine glycosylase family protein, partial [Solirubrobacterales bacterium]